MKAIRSFVPVLRAVSIGAALSLIGSLPVFAQTNSMRQAVELAVLTHPEVMARWHQYLAADEEQSGASSHYLPQLNVTSAWAHERKDRPDYFRERDYERHGAAIELRQMLFDGFATPSEVARLSNRKLMRYFELKATTEDIALEAVRAYLDVVRYRRLAELSSQNYATHRDLFSQIEQRVKAGVSKGVDLEQAAGRTALARSNELTERLNLQDVTSRYKRIIGENPAESLQAPPALSTRVPSESNLFPAALKQSPQLLASAASVRSAQQALRGTKSDYYPQLELRARKDVTENSDGVYGQHDTQSVEVMMTYNLFRGGKDKARENQFSHELNAAKDLRDKTCREIQQVLSTALHASENLREQLAPLSQHERSTSRVRDAYRQQFDLGQRTLLDLLDTENELFEARRALVNAQYDLELASARVLSPAGQLLPTLQLHDLEKPLPENAALEELQNIDWERCNSDSSQP